MTTSIPRRTVLAAGAGAAAGLAWPGSTAYAGADLAAGRDVAAGRDLAAGVRFTLNAVVLDGGEQVTSLTLNTAQLGPIDPASLTTGSFTVHAKATSPIPIGGDQIFSEYVLG